MRGNHIIWGRASEPTPAATNDAQRAEIARVTLTQTKDRKTWFDVTLEGKYLGKVRTTFWAMEYWPSDAPQPLFAGSQWNETDPPQALGILKLLALNTP